MLRACATCGRPSPTIRCALHGGSGRTRDRATQARFRRLVLERDGHACTDCGATHDLRACHIIPLHRGGSDDPSNGVTRCGSCDRATDPHAR